MNRLRRLFVLPVLLAQNLFGQTGTVETKSFFSPSLGVSKNFTIYLPDGYDSSSERYPVVYFLRGHEREWFNPKEDNTRGGVTLATVADSLIASKKIGKMILICPGMVSADEKFAGLGVNMLMPEKATKAGVGTGKFEDYFTKDLIAHIDSTYRTIGDRQHRGLDGFSLGGYMSLMLALKHPELFCSAGAYDGTHMWYNLDDPRVLKDKAPNDSTWLTGGMFDPAFGSPRNVEYMKKYDAVNILGNADSAKLALIRTISFHIQTAAYDGQRGNIDRGNHMVDALKAKGISNDFADIRLDTNAVHSWFYANEHAAMTLPLHWKAFTPHDK
jgi:S-formylglutathione hydrolase FrmB